MPENPQWTDADAVELRGFLASNRKFLMELENRLPASTEATDFAARALNLERREGARDMVVAIRRMAYSTEDAPERAPFINPAAA